MVDLGEMIERVALPAEHRDLVCQFLLVFSRFEAALKTATYARQDGERLVVEWRRFAREAGAAAVVPIGGVDVLVNNPPGRQTIIDNRLQFVAEQQAAEVTAEWLLEMVYRVRNNLFHGGKWPPQPERDGALLRASLAALAFFLDLSPRVREAYFAG
jgi:hypothetical protein